jgi:hypothetical protein
LPIGVATRYRHPGFASVFFAELSFIARAPDESSMDVLECGGLPPLHSVIHVKGGAFR